MSDNNKTYRIRTKIGVSQGSPIGDKYLTVKLTEKVDTIDIMSLEIKQENAYRFHSADYGVIVGRALANGGFGVPNVKVSIFIPADEATQNDQIYNAIYPYTRPIHKNRDGIRYNLLPDTPEDDCYQVVGTFPSKRMVLDDDNYMEIYDKYYKFTTRTNSAGDYMIFGVPTGSHTIHFDADLSDVGILSQRPRDMVYKGYNINQFENANQFKKDTNLANLPQIISQDDSVYVYPFWGNETENIIGITRHDIDINYKFEPTCVFIGSIISDTGSNHISKKCIPTQSMGLMEELVAGSGTIEMIRKKQNGDVEQFNIHGTQLINDNGVWCYQIPMNLDYMITDEYGNLVPSDDPTKGIATRTSVRFRISMNDFENDSENSFRAKVLVPNNPRNENGTPDYVFGSLTEDESFRDLLWNNVYTVKSFIPRFQKGNGDRLRRFSGIKECNYHGQNNPVPYNNMRVNLSFQFVIACLLVRLIIWLVGIVNTVVSSVVRLLDRLYDFCKKYKGLAKNAINSLGNWFYDIAKSLSCIYVDGETCDNLEGTWFFAPKCTRNVEEAKNETGLTRNLWVNMFAKVEGKKNGDVDYRNSAGGNQDQNSIDVTNADDKHKNQTEVVVAGSGKTYDYVISRGIDYFLQCIEISLAKEYRVIQFDFYNDWLNGVVYIPRWERTLRKKRRHGERYIQVRACNDGYEKRFLERNNKLTEQCAVSYAGRIGDNHISTGVGCRNSRLFGTGYKCHKSDGRKQFYIFKNGGAVHQEQTASKLYAYYFKPCEVYWTRLHSSYTRVNLFATDIVLLGSLSECNLYGIPVFTNELSSTSYQLPPSVASTDSTEEGFKYKASDVDSGSLLTANTFNGVFDFNEQTIGTSDDGSVTEESGIDWSYVGPGQGSNDIAQTYTPGGHFLGISCVNSETTIKSCVNLKRICEVGVWPSTRQEVFNGMSVGSESFLDIIPNGFIAKDDISDGSFRKMFATMNSNGLRTKVTDDGFVTYDFQYKYPENFDGALSEYSRRYYNEAKPIENGYLAKAGDRNEEGDEWPTGETESQALNLKPIRRSLEEIDVDYMSFRFGLKEKTDRELRSKYLFKESNGYSMPVYDNSFYFFFGLKPGATALEEFNKQFFAECEKRYLTEGGQFEAQLIYYNINNEEVKAFDKPMELSIYEDKLYGDSRTHLDIFTRDVPVKVTIDGERTLVCGDQCLLNNAFVRMEYPETGDSNPFTFEIGKHTLYIEDSAGNHVTKVVNVVQEKIKLCPEIYGYAFQDENYISESEQSLIDGMIQEREDFGGWFQFDWGNSTCEIGEDTGLPLFVFGNGEVGYLKSYFGPSITGGGVIFKGRTHTISYCWNTEDTAEYEEFRGSRIFDGVSNNGDASNFHVYAGEEGTYDVYVVYENESGKKTPRPIYVGAIYIGEPPAIDFDVFRRVLPGENYSTVTFRNPIIKLWNRAKNNWYNEIYGGNGHASVFSYDQIWYLKKNMFYIFTGSHDEPNFNPSTPSKRYLYVNAYYPDEIGNVSCVITAATNQQGDTGTTINGFRYTVEPEKYYYMALSGETRDGSSLISPGEVPNSFCLPVFYKPYYYQAVIWEGYQVFSDDDVLGNVELKNFKTGKVFGTIYNGIVYDTISGPVFGPTVLNDEFDLTEKVNDKISGDWKNRDFSNATADTRETKIEIEDEINAALINSEQELLITEGSPDDYDSEYTPLEFKISALSIGSPESWVVTLRLDSDNIQKMTVSNEFEEYKNLTVYLFNRFGGHVLSEDVYKKLDIPDIIERKSANPYEPQTGVTFDYEISGMTTRDILMENVVWDNIFWHNMGDTRKGCLKTRNLIRNGIDFNWRVGKINLNSVTVGIEPEVHYIHFSLDFIEPKSCDVFKNEDYLKDVEITLEQTADGVFPRRTYKLISEFNYSFKGGVNSYGVQVIYHTFTESTTGIHEVDDFTSHIYALYNEKKHGGTSATINTPIRLIAENVGSYNTKKEINGETISCCDMVNKIEYTDLTKKTYIYLSF